MCPISQWNIAKRLPAAQYHSVYHPPDITKIHEHTTGAFTLTTTRAGPNPDFDDAPAYSSRRLFPHRAPGKLSQLADSVGLFYQLRPPALCWRLTAREFRMRPATVILRIPGVAWLSIYRCRAGAGRLCQFLRPKTKSYGIVRKRISSGRFGCHGEISSQRWRQDSLLSVRCLAMRSGCLH